ncbi:hypothetical protein CCMA1212_003054 [Trichoderma ghanense]|uniref:Uncharacterized protein n=1 Tax=Trichoderma ghanense TaxID=65468 RepID=A0ABY2H9I3_9HYPO
MPQLCSNSTTASPDCRLKDSQPRTTDLRDGILFRDTATAHYLPRKLLSIGIDTLINRRHACLPSQRYTIEAGVALTSANYRASATLRLGNEQTPLQFTQNANKQKNLLLQGNTTE